MIKCGLEQVKTTQLLQANKQKNINDRERPM